MTVSSVTRVLFPRPSLSRLQRALATRGLASSARDCPARVAKPSQPYNACTVTYLRCFNYSSLAARMPDRMPALGIRPAVSAPPRPDFPRLTSARFCIGLVYRLFRFERNTQSSTPATARFNGLDVCHAILSDDPSGGDRTFH